MAEVLNALSIDLEDWFHAELVRPHVAHSWPQRRVEWAVAPMVELLQRYHVKATFFVVGDVIQHHPELVRTLYEAGHEIACHGWSHRMLWSLDRDCFEKELALFDQEAGAVLPIEEVVGFRAPSFSLQARSAWAIELLEAYGYRYDSSIFPLRTPLYGEPDAPERPYHLDPRDLTNDHPERNGLIEFPMTAWRWGSLHIPVSGGVYLRLMPQIIWLSLLKQINDQGTPFVIYVHPWETDSATPRVNKLNVMNRLITYYGIGATLSKFEALLQSFSFAPLRQVLQVPSTRSGQIAS